MAQKKFSITRKGEEMLDRSKKMYDNVGEFGKNNLRPIYSTIRWINLVCLQS